MTEDVLMIGKVKLHLATPVCLQGNLKAASITKFRVIFPFERKIKLFGSPVRVIYSLFTVMLKNNTLIGKVSMRF